MHRSAFVAVLFAGVPAIAHAQTTSEEEDLGEIEAALAADTAEAQPQPEQQTVGAALKALLNPDISFILDIAGAWFWPGDGEPLQTGEHDPTANGFNLTGLEMAVQKSVDPYFKFNANIVFTEEGVDLEEAYATTLELPYALQARAGRFLTRFGRHNPTHPHQWDFVDQPFFLGKVFGGEGSAGAGFEVSYLTPLPWFTEVIASGNQTEDGEQQLTTAVEQFFELSANWSLLTGLNYAVAPNPLGSSTLTHVGGIDLYLKWRPITYASYQQVALQTEWLARRRGAPGGGLVDAGGYAWLTWRFARRWQTGARWDHGTASRVDGVVVEDPDAPEWTGARNRLTAQLTFFPTEFSRLRAQGSVDRPTWADPIWAAFLTLEVSVGAHGAHTF
jgi:hypothetical protein